MGQCHQKFQITGLDQDASVEFTADVIKRLTAKLVLCLQISSGAFTGLGPQIRSLYLEKNKVRSLPNLHSFTALEVISLSDVPFSCDCQLLPLRK